MPKYLLINESFEITKSDTYGEDELEAVMEGSMFIVDITDPSDPRELNEDNEFDPIEEYGE